MNNIIREFKSKVLHSFSNYKYKNLSWRKNKKYKLLIQTNWKFKIQKWELKFKENILNFDNLFEIIYIENKYQLYSLYKDADICFLFSLSPLIEINKSQIKMIYFPISGLEFLRNIKFSKYIKIYNSKGISSRAIAEYTLLMALLLKKNIHFAIKNQVYRKWEQQPIINKNYSSINKNIIGIMGVGSVGLEVVKIFKNNNCIVYGYDIILNNKSSIVDKWFSKNEIDDFLNSCDFIVICLPLNDDTNRFFNIKKFKTMKPSSYLINVSRGDIVIEKDLIYALNHNIIAGAALDVFSKEPVKKISKIWKAKNIIITPHIAGNINMFVNEIQNDFINKIKNFAMI